METITQESNAAANTRWIRKTTTAPSIKGHALHIENKSAWCACGFYCGGLNHEDQWYPWRSYATSRHDLHRVIVGHLHSKQPTKGDKYGASQRD
jgi:hypothetical protein